MLLDRPMQTDMRVVYLLGIIFVIITVIVIVIMRNDQILNDWKHEKHSRQIYIHFMITLTYNKCNLLRRCGHLTSQNTNINFSDKTAVKFRLNILVNCHDNVNGLKWRSIS